MCVCVWEGVGKCFWWVMCMGVWKCEGVSFCEVGVCECVGVCF